MWQGPSPRLGLLRPPSQAGLPAPGARSYWAKLEEKIVISDLCLVGGGGRQGGDQTVAGEGTWCGGTGVRP